MRDKVHLLNDEKGTACFENEFSDLRMQTQELYYFSFLFSVLLVTCIYFAKIMSSIFSSVIEFSF